jgi:hypothetical protein
LTPASTSRIYLSQPDQLGCFLTLSHICPGAITLNAGPNSALAKALASSFLAKKHGFDPAAALAWVRALLPQPAVAACTPGSPEPAALAQDAPAARAGPRKVQAG